MLARIGVKRVRAGLGEQGLQHHVLAAAFGEMLAIGLAKGAYAGVAVFLVDAAGGIAMATVQTLANYSSFPRFCDARGLSRRANAV
jgi:hypothetical protein